MQIRIEVFKRVPLIHRAIIHRKFFHTGKFEIEMAEITFLNLVMTNVPTANHPGVTSGAGCIFFFTRTCRLDECIDRRIAANESLSVLDCIQKCLFPLQRHQRIIVASSSSLFERHVARGEKEKRIKPGDVFSSE